MRLGGRAGLAAASLSMLVAAVVLAHSSAQASTSYPEAVLLVSGFETNSPFTSPYTSPNPALTCDGKEGSEWNPQKPEADPPVGIAYALKQAGYDVFTAPVSKGGGTAPITPPMVCTGPGEPVPKRDTVINSNGGTAANGIALANLVAFLRDNYGVTDLHVVGHSDGGLWSRSGITQNAAYAGVTIQSLTTLGTPHTGSYLADLAMGLYEGNCDFSNRIEQRICDVLVPLARLVVKRLGKKATRELTSGFLTTWNPKQRIGKCPVSVIAGDHVNFGIPFLGYYTPSDGLVGMSSAQAKWALDINGHLIPAPDIPDLRDAGVYDVVHGASVGFLSKKNLLNQTQISQQVAENTMLSGVEACNQPAALAAAETESGDAVSSAANQVQRLRAPLFRLVAADRHGRLPKPGPEDFAVTPSGVSVRCGFTRLRAIPVMGDKRLRIHHPRGCETRIKVRGRSGNGVARALMLRSNPGRHVLVRLEGNRARIRIRGRAPKSYKALFLKGNKWHRLKLDRKGRTKLPEASGGSLSLRIRARGGGRGVPADSAILTLQR
jgi:triacylglycerol lipase